MLIFCLQTFSNISRFHDFSSTTEQHTYQWIIEVGRNVMKIEKQTFQNKKNVSHIKRMVGTLGSFKSGAINNQAFYHIPTPTDLP